MLDVDYICVIIDAYIFAYHLRQKLFIEKITQSHVMRFAWRRSKYALLAHRITYHRIAYIYKHPRRGFQ